MYIILGVSLGFRSLYGQTSPIVMPTSIPKSRSRQRIIRLPIPQRILVGSFYVDVYAWSQDGERGFNANGEVVLLWNGDEWEPV